MKKILIVVDYQKDFVTGSLGFPKAALLEKGICQKIEQYKQDGGEVVFTFDTHYDNYLLTQEGKKRPVPHCLKNSDGWNLYGKVAELCDESTKCFEKVTYGSLDLANYLALNDYNRVELLGVVTNICLLSNVILAKAALPEAEIVVDATCTASYNDSLHQMTLNILEGMHIDVINT